MAEINENVHISEDSDNIEVIETVEIIEVSEPTSYTIDSAEAFPALGETNENLKHQLLNGRELADQHPIAAITGLRDELDDIESLQVIYSPDRNQANYYLWQDENILQENRVGYFVSACSDINEIEICTSDNEIFGVTVDNAGFIGAQSDVARDIKYGLVVNTGIVHVRCEQSVDVGDYVVSNDYGYAQKNDNGYRVVGRHQINGVEYAEIILATPINQICKLSDNVENIGERMDDAEKNIVSAINVANAAYNKASESIDISEEALKNAIDAVLKADDVIADVDQIEEVVSSTNEIAVQAKTIAESATVTAEAIRQEVVKTSNETLAEVNDLIEDLEPITTWSDPETGNTGAEYLTTYIKEGLATKVEVQTVETLTNDNKSAIEKSAEEFSSFISSVDKYSVGEYSQAYGLTYEQAKSILKEGMIYVPTKHENSQSHSETFEDTEEENWFTPGSYYVWTINDQGIYDWVETKDSVAFFSEELTPSNALRYWYIDSNEPPEGYEAHALYINQDGQWTKVNILDGNVNNRITSMVQQRADKIAMDVANAQGDITSHQQWLDNNSANIQDVVSWKSDVENDVSQIATIKQTADDAGASIAQVVESIGSDGEVTAASIVAAINNGDSSVVIDADHVNITAEDINLSGYVTVESLGKNGTTTIDGARITTGSIQSNNYVENTSGMKVDLDNGTLDSAKFKINSEGQIVSTGGNIGGWSIKSHAIVNGWIENVADDWTTGMSPGVYFNKNASTYTPDTSLIKSEEVYTEGPLSFWAGAPSNTSDGIYKVKPWEAKFKVYRDGSLYATKADISGKITTTEGKIGGWHIGSNTLCYPNSWNESGGLANYGTGMGTSINSSDPAFWAGFRGNMGDPYSHDKWIVDGTIKDGPWYNHTDFYVLNNGTLYASKAIITGTIQAGTILQNGIKVGTTQNTFFEDWETTHTRWASTNGAEYAQIVLGYDSHPQIELTAHKDYSASNGIIITSDNGVLQGDWRINAKLAGVNESTYLNLNTSSSGGVTLVGGSWTNRLALNSSQGTLSGTWNASECLANGSDRNIKNSIEEMSANYSMLFDNLKPVRYKYNHGTSNRYHIGFIAQDVEQAVLDSNLTTNEFAGFIKDEKDEYYLRYGEFVALNTLEIQKLKAKVAELEALIKGE